MVSRKCLVCKSKSRVFGWPKNEDAARRWLEFIKLVYPSGFVASRSHGVCFKHFRPADFKSAVMKYHLDKVDLPSRLHLEPFAVPSIIHDTSQESLIVSWNELPGVPSADEAFPSGSPAVVPKSEPSEQPVAPSEVTSSQLSHHEVPISVSGLLDVKDENIQEENKAMSFRSASEKTVSVHSEDRPINETLKDEPTDVEIVVTGTTEAGIAPQLVVPDSTGSAYVKNDPTAPLVATSTDTCPVEVAQSDLLLSIQDSWRAHIIPDRLSRKVKSEPTTNCVAKSTRGRKKVKEIRPPPTQQRQALYDLKVIKQRKNILGLSLPDQLMEICDIFAGKLNRQGPLSYVHCRTVCSLLPSVEWVNNSRDQMAKTLQEVVSCCLGLTPNLFQLHSFNYDDPNLFQLDSFNYEDPNDLWLDVKTYILLIIKLYDALDVEDKPQLDKLVSFYLNAFKDGRQALINTLSRVKSPGSGFQRPLKKSAKQPDPASFPELEFHAAGSKTRSSQANDYTQTDGQVQASYLKELPLKDQLSHPDVVRKLAWIIQHDRSLNEVFWQAYNTNSYNTINRVPDILKGDNRMVVDSYAQTEGACVPVIQLQRLQDPSNPALLSSIIGNSILEEIKAKQDGDLHLDFVPNCGSGHKMDEVLQNINTNNSTIKFRGQHFQDLVKKGNTELTYAYRPATYYPPDPSPDIVTGKRKRKRTIHYGDSTVFDLEESEEEDDVVVQSAKVKEETRDDDYSPDNEDLSEAETDEQSIEGSEDGAIRKASCRICNRRFTVNRREICCSNCCTKSPEGQCIYHCTICEYKDYASATVTNHIQVVHKGKESQFKCKVCSKSFVGRRHLARHEDIHNSERRTMCEICGRKFTQISNYQAHMRQHTGEKPFQCEHCGQSFTHNVSLRKHFCETLGRRIEPLDQKIPNVGRPPANLANKDMTSSEEDTDEKFVEQTKSHVTRSRPTRPTTASTTQTKLVSS